ncbi:MAG: Rpp14/Pop5 family protein [Candidatus Nanohaloarchaea archaeon]
MKPLPPSLRENERYLRFKVHSGEPVQFGDLVDAVWDAVLGYLGARDASQANIWIVKNRFDHDSQRGVIKFDRETQEDVRAALSQLTAVKGQECFLEVEKISGSIDKL